MDRKSKIIFGVMAAFASFYSTVIIHDNDHRENEKISKDAMVEMQVAISQGREVDPVLAYKGDTMRRLNATGTWLSEKEVKGVIAKQFSEYIEFLPADPVKWSEKQKEVYDYALKSAQNFSANPDKARFREDLRRDLQEGKNTIYRPFGKLANTL